MSINWPPLLFALGALLFASPMLLGLRRLRALRRGGELWNTTLLERLARQAGIRREIQVVLCRDLAVPLTYGTLRPTILMPADAAQWSDSDVRHALVHELEHVRRGDWLMQLVARAVCALYWPHPLVWVAARKLNLEAERACDDAVVRREAEPERYAEQLVALARRMQGDTPSPALAMASRSTLSRRIASILDSAQERKRITPMQWVFAAAAMLVLLGTLAPTRFVGAEERVRSEKPYLDEPLFRAAGDGNLEAIEQLLDDGANPSAVLPGDGTPLMAAAGEGHLDAVRLLLDRGADPDTKVRSDGNALIVAADEGHADVVRLLLDRGADVNAGVVGDGNALIAAAKEGHLAVVQLLLDRGASVDLVVPGDENALINAAGEGRADVVRLLLARGANPNLSVRVERWDGKPEVRTPLRMARRGGHEDVISLLLGAGARD